MLTLSLDFETYYKKGHYGIQENGLYGYTHHELFDPYLVSVSDGEQTWAGHPSEFNWSVLEGAQIVSHNAAFDRTVYEAMVEQGMAPAVKYHAWDCSANLSAFICQRRSLSDAVECLLGVKVDKSMRSWMSGRTWKDAIDKGKSDALLKYAELDAKHCIDLWNRYSPQWPPAEQALSRLTIDQSTRGVMTNQELARQYLIELEECVTAIENLMPWVGDGEKPTSPKAIATMCRLSRIPCPPVKSHEGGEEDFVEWEETYSPRYPWIKAIADWRSVGKVLDTVDKIIKWSRPDGTVPFGLKYFGAHTGRWSGDSGLNMQNFRKEPFLIDRETYLPATESSDPEGIIRIDVRSLFIPRPGKRMIVCDLSQIEPRVLAWVCGNEELLASISGENAMSIYEVHARQSLGWTGGNLKELSKTDPEAATLYKRAKAEVLALGYGCGAEKYVSAALKMAGHVVDPEQAEIEVKEFRNNNPLITALWKELDSTFKWHADQKKDMVVNLPSGRRMTYRRPFWEMRRYRDRESGKIAPKRVCTADIGGIRKSLYGGLLAENWVQSVARDVFASYWLDLADTRGVYPLFSVHDEAVVEVDESIEADDIEHIMSQPIEWLPGCPIGADAAEVPHYKKA